MNGNDLIVDFGGKSAKNGFDNYFAHIAIMLNEEASKIFKFSFIKMVNVKQQRFEIDKEIITLDTITNKKLKAVFKELFIGCQNKLLTIAQRAEYSDDVLFGNIYFRYCSEIVMTGYVIKENIPFNESKLKVPAPLDTGIDFKREWIRNILVGGVIDINNIKSEDEKIIKSRKVRFEFI